MRNHRRMGSGALATLQTLMNRRRLLRGSAAGAAGLGLAALGGQADVGRVQAAQDAICGGEEIKITYGFWDDAQRPAVEQQIAAFGERRKQIAAQIPKPLFATYDRMARGRRGQAMAEIRSDGICSVCRVRIRPKVFSDVRKGEQMITCENCGRILYYRTDDIQSVEAASQD